MKSRWVCVSATILRRDFKVGLLSWFDPARVPQPQLGECEDGEAIEDVTVEDEQAYSDQQLLLKHLGTQLRQSGARWMPCPWNIMLSRFALPSSCRNVASFSKYCCSLSFLLCQQASGSPML